MASRQLRKLRQQQELLNLQKDVATKDEESDEEVDASPIVAKPRPNMFSGFAALGDMGGEDDDEEDEDEQKSDADEPAPAPQKPADDESAKKSKKSKKKKKKKGKQADTQAPAAPIGENEKSKVDEEDEIDRALKALKVQNEMQGGGSAAGPSSQKKPVSQATDLLGVNTYHLKDVNEMRRLFGKAMDAAQTEERAENQQQQMAIPQDVDLETYLSARVANATRRGGSQLAQQRGMFDTLLRTNPFIEGKKTWPRGAAQGLKMERITKGTPDIAEFAFAHDKTYDELEKNFFGLVQMYDPMQIVHFLRENPYHVSSLIQVSKVARQDQNSALAADLIERAVFTFGRVSLSEFRKKLEQGKARLDFNRPENRQFYLAGYNLIQKLILKGTYRTALEWAKLLLGLNHDDPYDVMNWVHVLAIRAHEAQWFLDLCHTNIFNRPHTTIGVYARQTVPLAHLQLKDLPAAQESLIAHMQQFPWLYCSLFSALNIDPPKSIWGVQPRDDDEKLHTELYIHVAKDLWNSPSAISLLKEAANLAVKAPDVSKLPASPKITLSTARWVYLDNTPALMSSVPRKMLHTASPNFDFDPLPPKKEDNIFSSDVQQIPWRVDGGGDPSPGLRAAAERLLANIPRERLEQAFGAVGGPPRGLLEAMMRQMGPDAGPPRAPFQASVEDEDDDDENWEDELEDEDEDDYEFGLAGEWGEGDHEVDLARAGFGFAEALEGVRSVGEFINAALGRGGFGPGGYDIALQHGMPGAWGFDDDLEEEEEEEEDEDDAETTDEEIPPLEDATDDEMPDLVDPVATSGSTDAPGAMPQAPPTPPAS